jgi:hypothetical protein
VPFSREQRSIVYQRSKKELDTLPFGTQKSVYADGYEWATHSLMPVHVPPESLRLMIGGENCFLEAGSLLKEPPPPGFVNAVRASTPESFAAMDA